MENKKNVLSLENIIRRNSLKSKLLDGKRAEIKNLKEHPEFPSQKADEFLYGIENIGEEAADLLSLAEIFYNHTEDQEFLITTKRERKMKELSEKFVDLSSEIKNFFKEDLNIDLDDWEFEEEENTEEEKNKEEENKEGE
jgi:hypothetical protein